MLKNIEVDEYNDDFPVEVLKELFFKLLYELDLRAEKVIKDGRIVSYEIVKKIT